MKPFLLHFRYQSETKGTFRYEEIAADGKPVPRDAAVVGILYVRKERLSNPERPPRALTVAVEMHE